MEGNKYFIHIEEEWQKRWSAIYEPARFISRVNKFMEIIMKKNISKHLEGLEFLATGIL